MISTTLIDNLPKELQEFAKQFSIPEKFLETDPELIVLILKSKSLANKEDKQSWFDMLKIMNTDQIKKLRGILNKEVIKLKEIEKKYETKKEKLKEKYINKFNEKLYIKKISSLKKNEENIRQNDIQEADSLLENL